MKATGIVRRIDGLGRLVLPKELCRTFNIAEGDPIEIFVNGETIILRKYSPGCSLCGHVDRPMTNLYPNRLICTSCVKIIAENSAKLEGEAVQV